jgi:hypothetical protein
MSEIVRPGEPPPWLIPFCASCDMPVEKFTVYPVKAEGVVDIEAQCHGKTKGCRITLEQMNALDSKGGHIVMFQRGQGFDAVR